MLIRHLAAHRTRDLAVEIADPDATVADLAEVLDPDLPVGPLEIDGRVTGAATPLDRAGIANGATVARPGIGAGDLGERIAPVTTLVVTAGPDAGRRIPLAPGRTTVGRRSDGDDVAPAPAGIELDDPAVSATHVHLEVDARTGAATLTDAGTTNGTWVDGVAIAGTVTLAPGCNVRCGASRFHLAPPEPAPATPDPPRDGASSRPWHRTARAAVADPAEPLDPPEPEEPAPAVTPVGLVAVGASVAVGATMVAVSGSWSYAAFALLGPVLLVANAVDSRRRRRRHRRRGRRQRRRDLAAFESRLRAHVAAADAHLEAVHIGPAEAARLVERLHPDLWARRAGDPDAYRIRVGPGMGPRAPVVAGDPATWPADVAEAVGRHATGETAIGIELAPTAPVAIVGPRPPALALARSLVVQAVAVHGPADLRLAVLASAGRAALWDWCAWLPHTRGSGGVPLLAGSVHASGAVGASLTEPPGDHRPSHPRTLVVIDDPGAVAARRSPARSLLRAAADPALGLVPVVLARGVDDAPAQCSIVIEVDRDGSFVSRSAGEQATGTIAGTSPTTAVDLARRLARLDDPETDAAGGDLPRSVALEPLLGATGTNPVGLAARWRALGADPPPVAIIGVGPDGPVTIDLEADGPHALVAGTTGAGKSELLRTLVASLAVGSSPHHVAFVLVDFKGGSAFDACARLPHTTGVVTDLDDALATRALRCLDAELRHRERRFREVGVADLAAFRRAAPPGDPLPRLVVVVDEFATLAAELPDFVDALVGIAERGRSLGVHLVLATQRPAGAVSERIRANTSLRIALRVQSPADSADVIDAPAAAALPRTVPGRALVRFGPDELVAVQTALSTGRSGDARLITVLPLGLVRSPDASAGPGSEPPPPSPAAPHHDHTDVDRLVADVAGAWSSMGGTAPRPPWPEPLPDHLDWPVTSSDAHAGDVTGVVVGLADDPDNQRSIPHRWRFLDGPLLAVGLPGSGTTTLALTAVLGIARDLPPHLAHVHAIDHGAGDLGVLAGLPHVGAVIAGDDRERHRRLVARLGEELDARRAHGFAPGATPRRFLVLDGVGAFRAAWDDLEPSGTWERLVEVATRGAEVGIHVLFVAEGPTAAPHRLVAGCRQRLVLRLGDRADHAAFGIPPAAVPRFVPGRAVDAETGAVVQVARPPRGPAAAVAHLASRPPASDRPSGPSVDTALAMPEPVGVLPTAITLPEAQALPGPTGGPPDDGALDLVVGVADRGLVRACLRLGPAAHAVVAGPPGSGRTTALATLARAAEPTASVVWVAVRPGAPAVPTGRDVTVIAVDDPHLDQALDQPGPLVALIDDADLIPGDHPVLASVARDRRPHRHVVAAARNDRLRGAYAHWLAEVRVDRCGLLLHPDTDLDGDLLGVRLPRRAPVAPAPGRGWLAGGPVEGYVQVARPVSPAAADP